MPIHDWAVVDPGIFHDFHQAWTIELRNALNGGALPPGFFAMAEQILGGPIPDVVTLQERPEPPGSTPSSGGVAVAEAPPRARFILSASAGLYAYRANSITIRHRLGRVVAVIEIVSPGNKGSQHALRSLVDKAGSLLRDGISLLVVDLFPPSVRDPQGIHMAIWEQFAEDPLAAPADKPLTVAAYDAGPPTMAYVEPVGVGDPLPDLPIFLGEGRYVPAPLGATYDSTWRECPEAVREAVQKWVK